MSIRIKIRRADGWDVVRLTRLLERGAQEQAESIWYPRPSANPCKKLSHVLGLIDRGFVVVAEAFTYTDDPEPRLERQRIIGAIGMAFAQDGWSDDWCLNNEWFYVHPEFRDADVADKLLTAVEDYASSQVDTRTGRRVTIPIVLGMVTGTDTRLKDMLMERRGYQYGGGNFVRATNHVEQQEDDAENGDSELAGAGESASG